MKELKYNTPVILKEIEDDSIKFKDLPTPSGAYPYRISLEELMGDRVEKLHERMFFHMVGDTGSVRHSDFQRLVASSLTRQVNSSEATAPSFMYHLGDIVYNFGEASEYPGQFLEPYKDYNAPIVAIPGNHDGDVNPNSPVSYNSLDAFQKVFCNTERREIRWGGKPTRYTSIQPHVYWTLETPLARFVGLYANVNRHGHITQEQRDWFVEELRYSAEEHEDRALLVCIHHAPYSADINHGSSKPMISFLEDAFNVAGIIPDAVFSGHVHNYQRFSKIYKDGTELPFIVAGAGGYADLHPVAAVSDSRVKAFGAGQPEVYLERYCDTRFGFLKMGVEKTMEGMSLLGEYYTLPIEMTFDNTIELDLYDSFKIPIKRLEGAL
ncbi:metallophosphoesterase family protein [Membranihabitans maritimus]|uniref:metallophosphoesterase family protein n=1 Tax=Membranihabitans maritimus TaxID=2904244 RepID=UPI001F375EF3|nr:metallophosphoesterase [Membranihabitans maritimus]